jgi:hypothetical protein
MYEFKARIPFDHAMALVRVIRSGEADPGVPMMLIGSIVGEIGAWRAAGNVISLESNVDCGTWTLMDLCNELQPGGVASADVTDPNFDPGIWVPIILKIIELWLARRGQR